MIDVIVWVVEDDEFYRESIVELIEEADGMKCAHAFSSCEAAIEMLNREDELPDVVLMDIQLDPNMSGVEGVEKVKAILPSVQVIMLTVHQDNESIFDALRAGANGYLLKENIDDILNGIQEAVNGGVPITAAHCTKSIKVFPRAKCAWHRL